MSRKIGYCSHCNMDTDVFQKFHAEPVFPSRWEWACYRCSNFLSHTNLEISSGEYITRIPEEESGGYGEGEL